MAQVRNLKTNQKAGITLKHNIQQSCVAVSEKEERGALNEMNFQSKQPKVKFIGENGNVFNLIGIASEALKEVGQGDKVKEMFNRIIKCGSYENALQIMMEYVDVY